MVIIITKNFNIPVKDFDAKKYAGYSKMLVDFKMTRWWLPATD